MTTSKYEGHTPGQRMKLRQLLEALEDTRRGLSVLHKLFEKRKMRTGTGCTDSLSKGIEETIAAVEGEK